MFNSDYRKIYGCPVHGDHNGQIVELSFRKFNTPFKIPSFLCETCKKLYIERLDGKTEYSGYKAKGIYIYYEIGPLKQPDKVYIYGNDDNAGLCDCFLKHKDKTRSNDTFIDVLGVRKIPGTKQCFRCNKIYVTEKAYILNEDYFINNGVNVVDKQKILLRSEDNFILRNVWEINNENESTNVSKMGLKPAKKVAAAYTDAQIDFEPYQYLPWLKMFGNGKMDLLISDEVGLGKTIEAGILIMEELTVNVNAKILVICPAFLREKWYWELKEKFLLDSVVFDGKADANSIENIVILPISRLNQYIENKIKLDYSMVIIDEVHYFKNSQSQRYKYLNQILNGLSHSKRIFMSATPINNSGNDYHSIERLFNNAPDKTNTTKRQAFINLPERRINDVYVDLTEEEQAYYDTTDALDPFAGTIYRHIGSSCLYALGKYAHNESELLSETKEELRNAIDELMEGWEVSTSDDESLETLKNLVVPTYDSKYEELKRIINNQSQGCRIVIFSHYIETIKYLHSELSTSFEVGYIYANNVSNNILCQNLKNRFIDAKNWFIKGKGKKKILICSDSCREGIDLDIASVLINYDLPFNPSILEQRIGRIDRKNQNKNMDIYNFHVNYTYDDRLHFILSAKLRFINFYANYGIGNPLNIVSNKSHVFESFIRYFSYDPINSKTSPLMSNDDFVISSRILRKIDVKLPRKDDEKELQKEVIKHLNENKKSIEKWFNENEIRNITTDQLLKQKRQLVELLGFSEKVKRKIIINSETKDVVAKKANSDIAFRKRIRALIKDYGLKLQMMEVTGLPMQITCEDIESEYTFGIDDKDSIIQGSIVEVLRNVGADIYEIE